MLPENRIMLTGAANYADRRLHMLTGAGQHNTDIGRLVDRFVKAYS
jgi:hypothetical protein